jgi:hypothetical protein
VEWCRVTSPIDGRISNKRVTEGNLVNGGAGQATLLTTVVSLDPIYCYVTVDEASVLKYAELAREGKRVSARFAEIPTFMAVASETGFPHEGVVDFVDNRIVATTGTVRATDGGSDRWSAWRCPDCVGSGHAEGTVAQRRRWRVGRWNRDDGEQPVAAGGARWTPDRK